ncbi:hypothetical protein PMAYCL1PPCAC_12913, partial [Pristionchus mayeri]
SCNGSDCTAEASLHYIAALLHGSIMQPNDFSVYRYPIHENFTDDKNLSPEMFAQLSRNASRSTDFNPR